MKLKVYKPVLLLMAMLFATVNYNFAQDVSVIVTTSPDVTVKTRMNDKEVQAKIDDMNVTVDKGVKELVKTLSLSLDEITPRITADINAIAKNIVVKVNTQADADNDGDDNNIIKNHNESGTERERVKNYSKTYPLDGNDRIKISNQYGKITVNTWERHEVKVDVQIKAEAGDDDYAQKLLDGVQINDSKNGDLVSFKTEIGRSESSWKIWNWGGNKSHKLTINYTVYMPARTDIAVEQSYGAIELPELAGRVKINSSYGSVNAENLSNASNEIDGSYGSLKVRSMNGGHLDFSYGSVDMDECNNIKADLSYGSFKLGRLKGIADLELSYEGGFKINELANTFKKLNIDASYSGVAVGIPGNNNFDFDVTTTYGGFNYNDDKVIVTSKTPPDGSKHIGPTRNYKGHFGKEGSESQINIHSSYGGVNFE